MPDAPVLPVTPSYLRVFAVTAGGESSRLALEYTKSLLRIAPVRLIPADGAGVWTGYESLTVTSAVGHYINVVIATPHAWVRTMKMHLPPKKDPFVGEALASSWEISPALGRVSSVPLAQPEVYIERAELWTVGVRNVLIALAFAKDQFQLESARKYDAVIVPAEVNAAPWRRSGVQPFVIGAPVVDHGHKMLRALVTGLPVPLQPDTPDMQGTRGTT